MEEEITLNANDALLIIDVQVDFQPGGALPAPEGEQIIPFLNDYVDLFKRRNKIYVTRDWHPVNHISFKENGGFWPSHCIQESEGAKFHPDLELPLNSTIVSKGANPTRESYSGFDDTDLANTLKAHGVSRVFVGGLATEYCVKSTVLDALAQGFEVILLTDAIKGIDLQPGDAKLAIEKMILSGAKVVTLGNLLQSLEITAEECKNEERAEKPLTKADKKKKARLRSRGPYRKARVER